MAGAKFYNAGMNHKLTSLIVAICALSLLAGCQSVSPTAEKKPNRFQPVIDKWVEQDAVNPPPKDAVLFIGSSSIRLWDSLHDDFPQYDVIQRGFGGSHISDSIEFADKIVTPYKPRAIVMFAGTNDIASNKSVERVFNEYKTFVNLARKGKKWGEEPVPIFFIGITPCESRWKHWPKSSELNRLVKEYTYKHKNLYYIDTPTPILSTAPVPGGPPSKDLFRDDLLHLSPEGYALWTRVITPVLEAYCPPIKKEETAK